MLYCRENARTVMQAAAMVAYEAAGVCVFCEPQLSKDHEVVTRTDHWSLVINRYPYRGTRHHLLMIPREHVTSLSDLGEGQRNDMWTALPSMAGDDYTLAVRNGDPARTGGTIAHLHVHIIVGNGTGPVHFKASQ